MDPSSKPLKTGGSHSKPRLAEFSKENYHDVVKGKFRPKKGAFVPNKAQFNDWLSSDDFQDEVGRNFARMLFCSLTDNTFGFGGKMTEAQARNYIKTLKTYKATSFTLGLPVYKVQNQDPAALNRTLSDFDTSVKTSCELGTHLRRTNAACKPFEVLLNLEFTDLYPQAPFDDVLKDKVKTPPSLYLAGLGNSKHYAFRMLGPNLQNENTRHLIE
jgi:hypothetical protein